MNRQLTIQVAEDASPEPCLSMDPGPLIEPEKRGGGSVKISRISNNQGNNKTRHYRAKTKASQFGLIQPF